MATDWLNRSLVDHLSLASDTHVAVAHAKRKLFLDMVRRSFRRVRCRVILVPVVKLGITFVTCHHPNRCHTSHRCQPLTRTYRTRGCPPQSPSVTLTITVTIKFDMITTTNGATTIITMTATVILLSRLPRHCCNSTNVKRVTNVIEGLFADPE